MLRIVRDEAQHVHLQLLSKEGVFELTPTKEDLVRPDGLYNLDWHPVIADEFNEEDHPRDPDGKFGFGGGKSTAHPHLKGNPKERKDIRAKMKEPGADQKKGAEQLVHSFATERARAAEKGDTDRVAALTYKIDNIESKYGIATGLGKQPSGQSKFSPPTPAPKPTPAPAYHQTKPTPPPTPAPIHGLPPVKGELTNVEKAVVRAYTGSAYKELNRGLRDGVLTEKQWGEVKHLNNALDKLPPHLGEVTRQASLNKDVYERYKPGMIVEERGFTSTSSKKNWSWASGSTQYHIQSKTGRSISHLSSHSSEQEVLFKSGTRFRVTKTEGKNVYMEEA